MNIPINFKPIKCSLVDIAQANLYYIDLKYLLSKEYLEPLCKLIERGYEKFYVTKYIQIYFYKERPLDQIKRPNNYECCS